jgi:amino acid transporter
LGLINSLNVKIVGNLNMLFTITKVFALLIVVLSGFWRFFNRSIEITDVLNDWFPNEAPNFNKIALAIYSSLFSFSGWYVKLN